MCIRDRIYSRNKKGKTTFGISAGIENTLVLDPEHGTDEMKAKNPVSYTHLDVYKRQDFTT